MGAVRGQVISFGSGNLADPAVVEQGVGGICLSGSCQVDGWSANHVAETVTEGDT